MESTIVIKVKHGETLRRFSSYVVDGELEFDMNGLRKKIIGLFSLPSEADITLTYIDEDGDVVNLVNDDDLRDVISQSLNPLRITVKLNEETSDTSSSESSQPMRSPRIDKLLKNLIPNVPEIKKSVPEPFHELVDVLSKLGLSYVNQASDFMAVAESIAKNGVQTSTNANLIISKPKNNEVISICKPGGKALKKDSDLNLANAKGGAEASCSNVPFNLNDLPQSDNYVFGSTSANPDNKNKPNNGDLVDGSAFLNVMPGATTDLGGGKSKQSSEMKSGIIGAKSDSESGLGSTSCPKPTKNRFSPIPVAWQLAKDSAMDGPQYAPCVVPFKGSYNERDVSTATLHAGVQCDSCSVHPIVGPRFKSKVKGNYDLCSVCFAAFGNEADYTRMDRPVNYPRLPRFKGFHNHRSYGCPPMPSQVMRGGMRMKPSPPLLDSCFIKDVSILDGTVMAPSAPFTKIWRMKNNGTLAWPKGTHLLWIGGDRFTDQLSIEIAKDGFPVDQELDIAIDFVAPQFPRRYASHWRLITPYGQQFGQRVWVIIQVDASLGDSTVEGVHGFNLNLPPVVPETPNMNIKPKSEEKMVSNENELKFPINDSLIVGDGLKTEPPLPPISYPIVDPYPYPVQFPAAAIVVPTAPSSFQEEEGGETNELELRQLMTLMELGFDQVDKNKEVLRRNGYDVEKSVHDLIDDSEWDPILGELLEMGFCDEEKNKKLLKKNNGSIKRVVMDLVAGEKP